MSVEVRLFIGYIQNKEIKMYLNQSSEWKEAKTMGNTPLTETCWQEKEYIGFSISSMPTYDQLKKKEKEVQAQLQSYCPKLNVDKHPVYLFPQIFLI